MEPVVFMTKNEYSYERLKQEIMDGTIRQGDKLVVSALSKRYNVSPMPIREALARLEQEGLVLSSPNRGAWVHKWDYNQFYELIQISIALETMASRLAAVLIAPGELRLLHDNLERMKTVVERNDVSAYLQLNDDFHMSIYRFSGNNKLYEEIRKNHKQTYPYTSIALHTRGRLTDSIQEHNDWLHALEGHDAQACARLCTQQRLESYYLFLDYLDDCLRHPEDSQMQYYLYSFSDAFQNMSQQQIHDYLLECRDRIYPFDQQV